MKKLLVLVVALSAMVAITACNQQQNPTTETDQAAAVEPAPAAAEPAVDTADDAAGSKHAVVLNGTMGCGHCSFQITEGCAPAMKADDGSTYAIQAAEADHEALMESRMAGGGISVTGTVSEVNGVLTVIADTFELQEKVDSVG